MFLRRAAVDGRSLLHRRYTQWTSSAALLPMEEDPAAPATLKYLDAFPQPDPKHDQTILAIPRLDSETNASVKERKAGRVPVIVFEQEGGQHGDNKKLISVRTNQVRKLVNYLGRSFFLSRLFELEVRECEFNDDDTIVERVRDCLETEKFRGVQCTADMEPPLPHEPRTRPDGSFWISFLSSSSASSSVPSPPITTLTTNMRRRTIENPPLHVAGSCFVASIR